MTDVIEQWLLNKKGNSRYTVLGDIHSYYVVCAVIWEWIHEFNAMAATWDLTNSKLETFILIWHLMLSKLDCMIFIIYFYLILAMTATFIQSYVFHTLICWENVKQQQYLIPMIPVDVRLNEQVSLKQWLILYWMFQYGYDYIGGGWRGREAYTDSYRWEPLFDSHLVFIVFRMERKWVSPMVWSTQYWTPCA